MDMEKSSICNSVVNFLLEENYLLTAFELLHELLDDGHNEQAIRLKQYFADPSRFPPLQIARLNSLTSLIDPQTLLQEKEEAESKLALTEYELRLAQEDISKLKADLESKTQFLDQLNASQSCSKHDLESDGQQIQEQKNNNNSNTSFTDLGPLKNTERRDLNYAVKEYLLFAGYRLTAMTFYEEVTDVNLDSVQNSQAVIPDALRHYYYHYISSTSGAAEEKIAQLRENEMLLKENQRLNQEMETLLNDKKLADDKVDTLTKSLEVLKKELKDKENLAQLLKQSLENQRKELRVCRTDIMKMKKRIDGSNSAEPLDKYKKEIKNLHIEIKRLKVKNEAPEALSSIGSENETVAEDKVIEIHEDKGSFSHPVEEDNKSDARRDDAQSPPSVVGTPRDYDDKHEDALVDGLLSPSNVDAAIENVEIVSEHSEAKNDDIRLQVKLDKVNNEAISEKTGLVIIQILADALPKIVPYVLINHREELIPLIMCAIEHHPDSSTRDSLTHTLFNLIKRPDEQQRRIIMEACVSLAKNVGEMRTETELLPQCWEQISHMYEERRLLVAQSCGDLAEYVRPEIRDSLILSIVQQLIEDAAIIVRAAAAHNLAMLLPFFLNMDKYFKVEELMFQLICDPSGVVVETTLKELVPAVIKWGNNYEHVLRGLLSLMLTSAQNCPPISTVKASIDSHLHVLGERERWNIDCLLRMLVELLPVVHQKAIETCPFSSTTESKKVVFSTTLLESYAREHVEWEAFEWMHVECFPKLIQLACLLPWKEDNLRSRISKFLLSVSEMFGESYTTCIMLPVFLTAVGDDADFTYFPTSIHSRIKGLRPRNVVAEKIAASCVLPLLLAGILGAPGKRDQLAEYLRNLLLKEDSSKKENPSSKHTLEIINAVRFICIYEENHGMVFDIIWNMVVSSNEEIKTSAANLLKVIVQYVDAKVASTNVLPALVTLGSDQNINVKCASIEAFGAVAQNFKVDMIVDKIRVQMGAFLEERSHEATIAVIHALVVAVPHTTEQLRDYLLSKIAQLTAAPSTASGDLIPRRERANAFCEAIRALDATDLGANSVKEFLLPSIQNLLKDVDALDPAHKEALEIIMKERSGASTRLKSQHSRASSLSNLFGERELRTKRDSTDTPPEANNLSPRAAALAASGEDTRFRRLMMGHFSEILRAKGRSPDEAQNP
ncbi:hypothetical protein AAHE18_05G178500 [Arachis hypogaea]